MSSENLSTEVGFIQTAQPGLEALGVIDNNLALDARDGLGVRIRAKEQERLGLIPSNKLQEAGRDEGLLFELVIQASNFLPAAFLEVGVQRARAVCKIETSGVDFLGRSGEWMGTGFMVSPNILLTNNHVLNSPDVAARTQVIFNFQDDPNGASLPTKSFSVDPTRLFLTSGRASGDLDFTFVWVNDAPGNEFGFIPLDRSAFTIVEKEFANIVQHPNGNKKVVVLQQNQVTFQNDLVLRYSSDTEPGSSGSCVFNNTWRPVALHHASRRATPEDAVPESEYINEGIKLSAIIAFLEKQLEVPDRQAAASDLVRLFKGSDALTGFFGALGREVASDDAGFEAVVKIYKGEADDIDVAFWNIKWFGRDYREKLDAVARVMIDMNLDVWAFEESSPEATAALVDHLRDEYNQEFEWAASEPDAPSGRQTTTVIWRSKTVIGERKEWPEEIDSWFRLRSEQFEDVIFESVEGKIFDRYPGLFYFQAKNRPADAPFNFYLVPLHLKAMEEGSKRRRLAAQVLAVAVKKMIEGHEADEDWVLGGDYNAPLATNDFQALKVQGLVPLSAADEEGLAFSYLARPKSLIDHIFLSANLSKTYGADDYFIVAADKTIPRFVKEISDHRPVLVRLSLSAATPLDAGPEVSGILKAPEDLVAALKALNLSRV